MLCVKVKELFYFEIIFYVFLEISQKRAEIYRYLTTIVFIFEDNIKRARGKSSSKEIFWTGWCYAEKV
jgi:hypothetical protein